MNFSHSKTQLIIVLLIVSIAVPGIHFRGTQANQGPDINGDPFAAKQTLTKSIHRLNWFIRVEL